MEGFEARWWQGGRGGTSAVRNELAEEGYEVPLGASDFISAEKNDRLDCHCRIYPVGIQSLFRCLNPRQSLSPQTFRRGTCGVTCKVSGQLILGMSPDSVVRWASALRLCFSGLSISPALVERHTRRCPLSRRHAGSLLAGIQVSLWIPA